MSAAVTFAFGAGLLATVNPCGFALLPSFLSFYLGDGEGPSERHSWLGRATQGLLVGVVLSAAFAGVFVIAGLIVSAGLRSFIDLVPWMALAIGAGLVVLGLAMLAGRHIGLVPAARVGAGGTGAHSYRRVALFGVTYALASLSCTLAVFLVVVSQALAVANPVELVAVFGAYAAGAASVLIALSLSAALAKGALARAMRRLLPFVNRLAGGLLTASGLYLIAYWLPSLGDGPASGGWVARTSASVSSTLSTFFAEHTAEFALGLVLLSLAGAAVAALNLRRRSRHPEGLASYSADMIDAGQAIPRRRREPHARV